jgi:spore coat protein JB
MIPNNSMVNYMPNNNSQMTMMNNKFKDNSQILDPYQGFIRGNLFSNLYNGYKNYKPNELNPTNEKDAMLEQWQQYNFALTDLDLYLDTHPSDSNALNLYNKYLEIEKQIEDKYESMYGPITLESNYVARNDWNWKNNPWPWEGDK